MQTDFRIEWIPLPAEREGEWRHSIELITEIMKGYFMDMQIDQKQNQYRFAWVLLGESETHYGTFLFDDPADARSTHQAMKLLFRGAFIWLEDHEHNKVEIPA